ncbi:hypothetical protein Q5A_022000 [Serratia inhibens PRI-2C]|nr:hypothetical protein Q5A_022000 [Serratia inhibens PRI-2C]
MFVYRSSFFTPSLLQPDASEHDMGETISRSGFDEGYLAENSVPALSGPRDND